MNKIELDKMGRAGFDFVRQFEMDGVLKRFYEELKVLVETSSANGRRQKEVLDKEAVSGVCSDKGAG